jgi:hypothetical protein
MDHGTLLTISRSSYAASLGKVERRNWEGRFAREYLRMSRINTHTLKIHRVMVWRSGRNVSVCNSFPLWHIQRDFVGDWWTQWLLKRKCRSLWYDFVGFSCWREKEELNFQCDDLNLGTMPNELLDLIQNKMGIVMKEMLTRNPSKMKSKRWSLWYDLVRFSWRREKEGLSFQCDDLNWVVMPNFAKLSISPAQAFWVFWGFRMDILIMTTMLSLGYF